MLFREGHGRVKADDGETAGDVQNRLDDRFTYLRIQVVQLRRVIPGHAGAIVAMVNVARLTAAVIVAFKHHGCV